MGLSKKVKCTLKVGHKIFRIYFISHLFSLKQMKTSTDALYSKSPH